MVLTPSVRAPTRTSPSRLRHSGLALDTGRPDHALPPAPPPHEDYLVNLFPRSPWGGAEALRLIASQGWTGPVAARPIVRRRLGPRSGHRSERCGRLLRRRVQLINRHGEGLDQFDQLSGHRLHVAPVARHAHPRQQPRIGPSHPARSAEPCLDQASVSPFPTDASSLRFGRDNRSRQSSGPQHDKARGFNRTENMRPLPKGDPDFARLYARRMQVELRRRYPCVERDLSDVRAGPVDDESTLRVVGADEGVVIDPRGRAYHAIAEARGMITARATPLATSRRRRGARRSRRRRCSIANGRPVGPSRRGCGRPPERTR